MIFFAAAVFHDIDAYVFDFLRCCRYFAATPATLFRRLTPPPSMTPIPPSRLFYHFFSSFTLSPRLRLDYFRRCRRFDYALLFAMPIIA